MRVVSFIAAFAYLVRQRRDEIGFSSMDYFTLSLFGLSAVSAEGTIQAKAEGKSHN